VSRVIRTEPASRTRAQLLAGASKALDGMTPSLSREELQDRLAFLGLCLAEVRRSLDQTIEAWEKRGYWVKADRFRDEWRWLDEAVAQITQALESGNLAAAVELARALNGRLPLPHAVRGRGKDPVWLGSWERWIRR